jgi:hypothetical protein
VERRFEGLEEGIAIGQWLTMVVGVRVEGMPERLTASGRLCRLTGWRVARGQGGARGRVSWAGEWAGEADTGEVLDGGPSSCTEQGGTKGVDVKGEDLGPTCAFYSCTRGWTSVMRQRKYWAGNSGSSEVMGMGSEGWRARLGAFVRTVRLISGPT